MSPRPERRPDPRSERRPRSGGSPPEARGSWRSGRPGGGRGRWERDADRRPYRSRPPEARFPDERRSEGRRFGDDSPAPPDRYGGPRARPLRTSRPSRFSATGRTTGGRSASPDRSSRSDGREPYRPDGGRSGRPQADRRDRVWTARRPDDRWQLPPPSTAGEEGESHAAAAPSDLIWGRHSVQATLESGRPIHRIWCTPEMRFSPRFLQLLRDAKASGVLVEEVTWARLGQITGGAVHQGIALQPAAAETLDLASLIEGCRNLGEPPLLMAVDGLTDPRNLGAIVRSAEALGAHGMVLPQRRNAGLTGTVAKVAAGALEHLPVARVVNLNRSLETLRQEGYRIIGLAAEGTLTPAEADLEGPLVIVTGSEADGLSLLTRRHCDALVRIPLRGATPSLNASVATSLMLYEVARRGWMRGVKGTAPSPRLVRPSMPAPAGVTEGESPAPEALAGEGFPAPWEPTSMEDAPSMPPEVPQEREPTVLAEEPRDDETGAETQASAPAEAPAHTAVGGRTAEQPEAPGAEGVAAAPEALVQGGVTTEAGEAEPEEQDPGQATTDDDRELFFEQDIQF